MPRASVQFKGPFFEAAARNRVLRDLERDIRDDVARESVNLVQLLLDAVLRHPTGYYRSRIRSDNTTTGALVSDSNVIYGPWLEGVSRRNQETRFKGYFTFRRAGQILPEKAHAIARRHVTRAVMRLN